MEMGVSMQSSQNAATNESEFVSEASEEEANLSSDDEIRFKPASQDFLSEGEIEEEISNDQRASSAPRSTNKQIRSIEDRQSRIRAIDQEMKQRLNELHVLMEDGGLVESAQVLSEQFGLGKAEVSDDRQKKRRTPEMEPAPRGELRQHNDVSCNVNHNAAILKSGRNSRSEETIYDNAVPKRASTSSEEDQVIDTSGDSEVNKLIDELLVTERNHMSKKDSGKDQSCSMDRQSILPEP